MAIREPVAGHALPQPQHCPVTILIHCLHALFMSVRLSVPFVQPMSTFVWHTYARKMFDEKLVGPELNAKPYANVKIIIN